MRWSPPSARSRVREGAAALVALHQPGGHARRAPGHPHAAHVQDVRAPPGPGRPADARARCRELGAVGRGRGLCPLRRDRRSRPQETALRPHARVEGHLQPLGGAVPIVGPSRVRAGLDAHAPLHRRVRRSRRQASLVRLALGELVSSERYGDPAPKELTEERQPPERRAPVAVPDLMTAMGELVETTRFTDAPVPSEHVFEILRAGQWAPSAGNFQPIRYVVLRERERLAALDALARESAAVSAHWFPRYRQGAIDHPQWADVPAAVALIADPTKGGPHIHGEATHVIGGGLAAQNMRLMAHALGLGTSVITHWIEEKVKVLIDCPRDWDLVGVMPVGTPAESPACQRRQVAEVGFQDLFGRRFPP